MNTPLISVIMPTYNCGKYISLAIQSVIDQSYKNWELIIINDGSTDETIEICNNYLSKDKRIKIINKKNEGVSTARNIGISIATGEYLSFLDADDTYHMQFLEKSYKSISNNRYDLSYSGFNRIQNTVIVANSFPLFLKGNIFEEYIQCLKQQNHICHICSILIKARFLKENKLSFSPTTKNGEDTAFILKALSTAKVNSTPEFLYNYNIGREGSATTSNKLNESIISILNAFYEVYILFLEKKLFIQANSIHKLILSEWKFWLFYSVSIKDKKLFNILKKYKISFNIWKLINWRTYRIFIKIKNKCRIK